MIETFTIVGGASAYAPGLVRALLHRATEEGTLALEEVRLFDIDAERLAIVERLCRTLSRAHGEPFEVTSTTDKAAAVDEIDALLNSSRPGGFECRRIDETLPLEFDIPGQETVGPGGFFFALRSVPEALDLADHVRRLSPDALWLNYTNPTNIVGQALHERTDLDVLTLCDQSDEDLEAIAEALGRDPTDCTFECIGLNHATWYSNVEIAGRELPTAAYDVDPPAHFDEEHALRFRHAQRLAIDREKFWPNSYLPYYFRPEAYVELGRRVGPRTDAILESLDAYYAHFEEVAESDDPELQHHRGSEGFGDMAVDVLSALASPEGKDLVLNLPNRDATDLFADDTVVEMRARLHAEGVERADAPDVPEKDVELLQQLETYQRRTAVAAATGDPQTMLDALASNPLVPDAETAGRLLQRAEEAYGSDIPAFD